MIDYLEYRALVPCGMHGQNDSTYEPAAILRRDEAVQRQRTSWCICDLRLGIASGNCDSDDSDTTLKSARRIKLGYETLGSYPMFLSLSRFEQCIVVAERPLPTKF